MLVKAVQFQAIQFTDKTAKTDSKIVILLYALGEDGIIREFSGGVWRSYPISASSDNNSKL